VKLRTWLSIGALAVRVVRFLIRRKRARPPVEIVNGNGESVPVIIEQRGKGRLLNISDFTAGRIELLSRSDLGDAWSSVSALSAYRLQEFLRHIPQRWSITSAYRTAEENRKAGGAPDSQHVQGRAFDVWIYDAAFSSRLSWYVELARAAGFTGFGLYRGKPLVHLDTRSGDFAGWGSFITGGKKVFISLARALSEFGGIGAGAILAVVALFFLFRSRS